MPSPTIEMAPHTPRRLSLSPLATRSCVGNTRGDDTPQGYSTPYRHDGSSGDEGSFAAFASRRPLLVNLLAMSVLAAIGDFLAQCLEGLTSLAGLDAWRTLRFTAFRSGVYAPLFTLWNTLLEYLMPAPGSAEEKPPGYERVRSSVNARSDDGPWRRAGRVLGKVTLDALIWTPVQQIVFYVFLAAAEVSQPHPCARPALAPRSSCPRADVALMPRAQGRSFSEGWARCVLILPRSVPASWLFWTPVQCLTFSVVPIRLRLVWIQSVSILWNVASSTFNAAAAKQHAAGAALAAGPLLPAPGLDEAAEAARVSGGEHELELLRQMYEWCADHGHPVRGRGGMRDGSGDFARSANPASVAPWCTRQAHSCWSEYVMVHCARTCGLCAF